ncbi:uncharacterized protein LOC106012458 [Aplysia californica]|uniref:Uncharacterized protein LOC106012458 n=1 Tax=Aplysia californica TaxID=6500 RepID=A0ABM1A502_APLCA|nr:uncharacterized protein LOC106012458 [Aplysia californica]
METLDDNDDNDDDGDEGLGVWEVGAAQTDHCPVELTVTSLVCTCPEIAVGYAHSCQEQATCVILCVQNPEITANRQDSNLWQSHSETVTLKLQAKDMVNYATFLGFCIAQVVSATVDSQVNGGSVGLPNLSDATLTTMDAGSSQGSNSVGLPNLQLPGDLSIVNTSGQQGTVSGTGGDSHTGVRSVTDTGFYSGSDLSASALGGGVVSKTGATLDTPTEASSFSSGSGSKGCTIALDKGFSVKSRLRREPHPHPPAPRPTPSRSDLTQHAYRGVTVG